MSPRPVHGAFLHRQRQRLNLATRLPLIGTTTPYKDLVTALMQGNRPHLKTLRGSHLQVPLLCKAPHTRTGTRTGLSVFGHRGYAQNLRGGS